MKDLDTERTKWFKLIAKRNDMTLEQVEAVYIEFQSKGLVDYDQEKEVFLHGW